MWRYLLSILGWKCENWIGLSFFVYSYSSSWPASRLGFLRGKWSAGDEGQYPRPKLLDTVSCHCWRQLDKIYPVIRSSPKDLSSLVVRHVSFKQRGPGSSTSTIDELQCERNCSLMLPECKIARRAYGSSTESLIHPFSHDVTPHCSSSWSYLPPANSNLDCDDNRGGVLWNPNLAISPPRTKTMTLYCIVLYKHCVRICCASVKKDKWKKKAVTLTTLLKIRKKRSPLKIDFDTQDWLLRKSVQIWSRFVKILANYAALEFL